MDIQKAHKAIRILAMQKGKTEKEIVSDIEDAIAEAIKNKEKDPKLKRLWDQIPCKGDMPNAYELIAYIGEEVVQRTIS